MDLQEIGVDLGDHDMLRNRSWRWLRVRIIGLLSRECRTQRILNPQKPATTKDKAAQ